MLKIKRRFAARGICFVLVLLLVLLILPGQAQAARFNYRIDPYDGQPVYYVDSTTTSFILTVRDAWYQEYGRFSPSTLGYVWSTCGDWYFTPILVSGSGNSSTRRTASITLMSGLTPGATYTLSNNGYTTFCLSGVKTVSDNPLGAEGKYVARQATTEPNIPTGPTFSNITATGVTINWTANGNGSAAKYKLYRGSSASGPWSTLYDGTGLFYTDTGLAGDTTYYYRLCSYISGGAEHYAPILNITTSADPAVAAAQAARGAAEAAFTVGTQTKTSIDNLKEEFIQLKQEVQADVLPPTITAFCYSLPYVAVLRSDTGLFNISAHDNKTTQNNLRWRYKVNSGEYSEWDLLSGNSVAINVGGTCGDKAITLDVKDENENISTVITGIWRL